MEHYNALVRGPRGPGAQEVSGALGLHEVSVNIVKEHFGENP